MSAFCSNIFWLWKKLTHFSTELLYYMRGNKKNRYSSRMYFIFDKKQLDSFSSIAGGSNFSHHLVSALNGEKRNINTNKKNILKLRSQYYQDEWHLATTSNSPRERKFRNSLLYFKIWLLLSTFRVCNGRWAVLDLSSILFIKSELHCTRFTPLCNSEILWNKL